MSIKIASNFAPRFNKTLDDRQQFVTLNAMKNFDTRALTSGILTFNLETNLFYVWNSHNPDDPVLGKWSLLLQNTNVPAIRGVAATYHDLLQVDTATFVNNDLYIVSADENHDDVTTIYSFNVSNSSWTYAGIFTVDVDPVVFPFTPNAHYRQYELCQYNGTLFSAKRDFTADSIFNPRDWDSLNDSKHVIDLSSQINGQTNEFLLPKNTYLGNDYTLYVNGLARLETVDFVIQPVSNDQNKIVCYFSPALATPDTIWVEYRL